MLRGGPMHTAWSAKRTCRLSRSASECTATVLMPRSLHAQITRSAISPRLAIRIFLNMAAGSRRPASAIATDGEERIAVLDGLAALAVHLDHLPRHLGLDLVHELHRFDDAQDLAHAHAVADVHERRRVGVGSAVERAD